MLLCVLLIYRTLFKILIECPLTPPDADDNSEPLEYQECIGLIRLDLPLCFSVTTILFIQAWPIIAQHWPPWSPFLLFYRITSPSLGELTVKFSLMPPTNAVDSRDDILQQDNSSTINNNNINNPRIFSTFYLYELYSVLKISLLTFIRKINIRLFMLVYTTSYRSILPILKRLIDLVIEGTLISQKQEELVNSQMNTTNIV